MVKATKTEVRKRGVREFGQLVGTLLQMTSVSINSLLKAKN